ncbi:MAG TPA: ion transporter, partial [archaeon]|nr:ion transporter [archaeon]
YPWSMLVGFVDGWELFHVISCVLLIAGVGLNAFDRLEMVDHVPTMMLLAFASAGISLNILKYFEYLKQFYVLLSTLRIAASHVLRYLITALPIFFAYVIMGVLLFSPYSSRFESIIATAVTLFSLINGDEIHATFENLISAYPFQILAELYLFSFVALFITSILPVFLFIIEDSYHNAKERGLSPEDLFSADAYSHLTPEEAVSPWKNHSLLDIRIMFHVLKREFGHRWESANPRTAAAPAADTAADAGAAAPAQPTAAPSLLDSSSEVELSETTHLIHDALAASTPMAGAYVAGAMGGGATSVEVAELVRVEMAKLRSDLTQKAANMLAEYTTRQQEMLRSARAAFEQQLREMIERETDEVVRNLT